MIKKCFLLCLIAQSLYAADQDQIPGKEINRNRFDVALEEADELMSQNRHSPTTTAVIAELAAAAQQEIERSEDYIARLIEGDDEALERLSSQLNQKTSIVAPQDATIDDLHAAIALMKQQQKKALSSRGEALEIAQKYAIFTAKQAETMQALQAQIRRLETELAWTRAAAQKKT